VDLIRNLERIIDDNADLLGTGYSGEEHEVGADVASGVGELEDATCASAASRTWRYPWHDSTSTSLPYACLDGPVEVLEQVCMMLAFTVH
jgi:hypothetical protein